MDVAINLLERNRIAMLVCTVQLATQARAGASGTGTVRSAVAQL